MEITGSYPFDAPLDRVWTMLMDPSVIARCIPRADLFEPEGDNRYRVAMTVALGAITGSYHGVVSMTNIVPQTSYTLTAEGQGRPGFVKGTTVIALRAEGETTVVDVTGTVQTGGPIARMGQRLVGSVAKMMLDRFFGCLQRQLTAPAAGSPSPDPGP